MKSIALAAVLAAVSATAQAATTTIDFDAFPADYFTSGTEDGFTLTGTNAEIVDVSFLVNGFSNPNYITVDPRSTGGTLTITKTGGGSFTFQSFAGYYGGGNKPSTSYSVQGLLGGSSVGTDSWTVPAVNDDTADIFTASVLANKAVDTLVFSLFTATGAATNAPLYDNIVLGDAPATPEVPVPAAGFLLLGGIGALAAARRRKA